MRPQKVKFLCQKSGSLMLILSLSIIATGCENDEIVRAPEDGAKSTSEFDSYIASTWASLVYSRVKADAMTPPPASRTYGYFGLTMYESVMGGMPGYQSIASQLNGGGPSIPPATSSNYHWPTVVNTAVAIVLSSLLTSQSSLDAIALTKDQFDSQYASETNYSASVTRGMEIGNAIVAWSQTDGYSGRNLSYTPCTDPGCWTPTPPAFADALEPGWGRLRPFVLPNGDAVGPGPIPTWSTVLSSEFYQAHLEIYDTTGIAGANLTQDQRDIALFWLDGPGGPSGHSMEICRQVVAQLGLKLDGAAVALAKVGMACADAFISCWWWKFNYQPQLLRPITYIQTYIDPAWTPLLTTPNFPAYPSGHSTDAGASSRVMADLWGDNISFTDHTHDAIGLEPRRFSSFAEAGLESAVSRLYGGVHWKYDNYNGFALGQEIGSRISALQFKTSAVKVALQNY